MNFAVIFFHLLNQIPGAQNLLRNYNWSVIKEIFCIL